MTKLFYDDEFAALREVIEDGKGYKESASHLWPGMKPESAYAKLKACTNEAGDQRLKVREIVALMRFNDRFDFLYHLEDECLHTRSTQKAPADAEAQLVARIGEAASTLERAMKSLDRLRDRHT